MSDTETVNGLVEEVTTYVVQLQAENAKLQASNEVIAEDHAVLCKHNAKLRELLQRLLTEYRYMRVRPRAVYLQHEERMRAIEEEMREMGIEVEP